MESRHALLIGALGLSACAETVTPVRILVADPGLGEVRELDAAGTDLGVWLDASDLPGEARFAPAALRSHGEVVWVAHDGDPAVFAADDSGFVAPVLDNASSPVRVEEPCAFTESPDGSWLLANDSRTAVHLDSTGEVLTSLADRVLDPHGIATLGDHVYVVSSPRASDQAPLRRFGSDGSGGESLWQAGLSDPTGILAHDGTLIVADWGADQVVRVDENGVPVEVLIDTRRPVSLALDPDGRLLVLGDEGLLRVDLEKPRHVDRLTDPTPFEHPRNLLVLPD